jgi:hypothetical protein
MAPLRVVPLKRCESICGEHAIEALALLAERESLATAA